MHAHMYDCGLQLAMDITTDRQQVEALRELTNELLLQGDDVEVTSLSGCLRARRQRLEAIKARRDVSICRVKFRPPTTSQSQGASLLGKLTILDVGKDRFLRH